MKIGTLAFAASGAIALALPLVALPVEAHALGGGVGLALTGAGMIAFGTAIHRLRKPMPAEAASFTPALAPLPRFFAEERARSSGQVIPFGRKLARDETPDLPPMLEAQLKKQLLRRAERVCRTERD
jgi:hypothetical protein